MTRTDQIETCMTGKQGSSWDHYYGATLNRYIILVQGLNTKGGLCLLCIGLKFSINCSNICFLGHFRSEYKNERLGKEKAQLLWAGKQSWSLECFRRITLRSRHKTYLHAVSFVTESTCLRPSVLIFYRKLRLCGLPRHPRNTVGERFLTKFVR